MADSFFSRLSGKFKKQPEIIPTPDLSRIDPAQMQGQSRPLRDRSSDSSGTVDITGWLTADLDRLSKTWTDLHEAPEDSSALTAFGQSVHNLHGASGAYGGGALTRLTGSLQTIIGGSTDIAGDAALINLHVQACHAAALGNDEASEEVANAVCDALETQVETALEAIKQAV